jgi:general secretion pathway protein F/type IV pilus assembly protein PilC
VATFAYVARDGTGRRVSGTLSGPTAQSVLAELQARHLAPVRVKPVAARFELRRRVSTRQLATMYRQLGDLLRAGVPLLRALRLLGRMRSTPVLARIMSDVADAVADGARLVDALAAHEDTFPPVQLAMIRAGERGGFLEQVLTRLASFLEMQAELRTKVVGSLIYPAVLLSIGMGIVTFALVVFVPKFEAFYSRIAVPLPTRILLGASKLFTGQWPLVVIGLMALTAAAWATRHHPGLRRVLSRWSVRAPGLGGLVRGLAVARFARVLGTLLHNGVPLLTAMQISRDTAGNALMEAAIDQATEAVRAGETLAQPLASSGLFGEDVVEMISVGESANNLAEVLAGVAATIEQRVDRALALLLRLLEPALLLALAAVVLFIFVALIVPLLRLSASI